MYDIVTLNGYKIKDEKAVRSYENVAQMKADTKLKEGYHVKTKGYYSVNDGGEGTYIIRLRTIDDIEDNALIHFIGNNLVAEFVCENDFISAKQIGGIENDYIDLQLLYDVAIALNKSIFINGVFKVDTNMICDNYIEVYGGKLIVDSFESTDNDTFDVFKCNAPCYIHDIEIVSTNDKIPSINHHAGIDYGYASNVKVAEVRSSNCIFERITGDFVSGIGIYHPTDILTNIKIDKCYFNHCELGIFCERGEFNCTNSTFIQSTDVQSIYYHPFYIAFARNSNIDNIEIGNNALVYPNVDLTTYLLADIIHLYNSNDDYLNDSYNINISNINVRGEGFKKFCQARFIHDINFNNINASIQKYFLEIGNRFSNINFNNCNINNVNYDGQARIVITTNNYNLSSTDNLRINNSKFTFTTSGSQYFDCCNVTLNNCTILADSNLTLPRNNSIGGYLKVINCYISLNRLSNLYLGTGYVEYKNCYFDNTEVANYINSDIQNTLNIKVLNCYFNTLKNMFESEKMNSNVCYNVYGHNPDNDNYRTITNFNLLSNQ